MSAHAGQGPIAPQKGDWLTQYNETRDRLEAANAYDRGSERDACGVGLVCSIDGTPRRDVVDYAIRSLKAVAHRGAVDPDGLFNPGSLSR